MMADSTTTTTRSTRNPNLCKWNILFDTKVVEWISFKPQLGLHAYPCYACRNMFGSKNSFMDHVNRRALLLKYRCNSCPQIELLFYNPCSFLLHARQHFTLLGGQINLDNLKVCILPFGLGGFLPHPSVPMLYDVEEDNIGEVLYINTRFYNPMPETMGQSLITLIPNEIVFLFVVEANAPSTALVLKQISSNIPKCKFITIDTNRFNPVPYGVEISGRTMQEDQENNNTLICNTVMQIKDEPEDITDVDVPHQYDGPIITKIETVTEPYPNFPSCPECRQQVENKSMGEHFLETNKPFEESLKCSICKYIAPTKCSLQAHERIHDNLPPYVCPECGKDFDSMDSLHEHLEEVCFHLTKQVRLRCPGRKCGKVFAQVVTFTTHFAVHMQPILKCVSCQEYFMDKEEYSQHAINADGLNHAAITVYSCTVCSEVYNEMSYTDHIYEHATKKKQCLYVYICKHCRSYFRSTTTYATHLLRCTKLISQTRSTHEQWFLTDKQKRKYTLHVLGTCLKCNTQIKAQVQRVDNMPERCPNCNEPFQKKNSHSLFTETVANEVQCVLCTKKLDANDLDYHFSHKQCEYFKPIVEMEHIRVEQDENASTPKLESPNRKKRRKAWTMSPNNKQRRLSVSVDPETITIEPDEPVPFDGTYYCKLCEYHSTNREAFQGHVLTHRSVSTAYQCMECGECFVVKPSLEKHLLYYHQIDNIDVYFKENDCFDKDAVKKLADVMHLAPGETTDQVRENQCRVCLLQFNDSQELSKHIRVHGMAFLLKNSK